MSSSARHAQQPDVRRDLEDLNAKKRLAGGSPIQRKRIDKFIAQVAKYDFERCALALHGPTSPDQDLVLDIAVQSSDVMPSMRFAQVLADRRAAKLYSFLKAMPPQQARRKAETLFDENLVIHESDWARAVERQRQQKQGLPEIDAKPIPISYNVHALSVSLFLCAAFCEPRLVLNKLDRWYEVIGRQIDEIYSDPQLSSLGMQAAMDGLPERLFVLNIYTLLLERNGCESADRLADATGMNVPPYETVPFCSWDALTNPFDFTHVHGGVPVDNGNVLMTVNFARSWRSLGGNEKRQDEVLAAVRKLVEGCTEETANKN